MPKILGKKFISFYLEAQAPDYFTWLDGAGTLDHPRVRELSDYLEQNYQKKSVIPSKLNLFKALTLTPLDKVKVVILGQDPYPNKDSADGLAFSAPNGSRLPGSLRNIFKCLYNDLGIYRQNSDLRSWAEQGVLLLNTSLTTEAGRPNGHKNMGWHLIVDHILRLVGSHRRGICYVLWGKQAQEKKWLITDRSSLIVESVHPSPLSAHLGFLDHKPFSQINQHLEKNKYGTIKF